MKIGSTIFKLVIKFYWLIFPEHKRRYCLFNISCSNYVYQQIENNGFCFGLMALKLRHKQCRGNYKVYYSTLKMDLVIELADGTIVERDLIKEEIIKKYLE